VEVAIGVDSHKGSLAAAVVDPLGRVLGAREFPNDPNAHEALLRWVRGHGSSRRIGIECSFSYGSAAARYLLSQGEDVREVPTSLAVRQRRRRPQGKSDLIDAVAIARVVAAEKDLPSASRVALLSDLRLLVDLVTVEQLLAGARLDMPPPLTPYVQAARHVPAVDQLAFQADTSTKETGAK
jgi:transposase